MIHALSDELNFTIVEWLSPTTFDESPIDHFQEFLESSTRRKTLAFGGEPVKTKKLILIEDLPPVLHSSVAQKFQAGIQTFLDEPFSWPLVFIVTDVLFNDPDSNLGGAISVKNLFSPQILASRHVSRIR